jgi:WD40 repeat protein
MNEHDPADRVPGESLLDDQSRRWRQGERPPVEDYLRRYPDLRGDPGAVLNLIYHEFLLRQRLGESPRPDDYLARFPRLAEQLARLFAIHDLGGRETLPAPARLGAAPNTDPAPPDPRQDEGSVLAPPRQPGEIGRLGGYRVLKRLGHGGMGIVFLAEDPVLGRLLALKVLRPDYAARPEAAQRFLREARLAAALKSDHVVTVYQVGEERGVPFLAMELLQGETLEGRLRAEPRLPLPQIVRVGRQVALGLAAAHERGLVHRDVKPGNLWLETPASGPLRGRTEEFRVKILDFGLAREVEGDEGLTHSGVLLGTPAYMSPEQADGAAVDGRADLFSLGCVLYRLCTGSPPFRGPTTLAVLKSLATTHPPPVSRLRPDVPAALGQLIDRLLAKNPADRPAGAAEVAELFADLDRPPATVAEIAPAPVAQPPSPVRPAGRGRSLRPWLWAAAVLLLAGGALLAWRLGVHPGGASAPQPGVAGSPEAPPDRPFDRLDPRLIPAVNRQPWQPRELVAVLGDLHGRSSGGVNDVAVSPDGKWVAVCSLTGFQLYESATMTLRWEVDEAPFAGGGAFLPDGKTLVARGRLWDLTRPTPEPVAELTPGGAGALALSANGLLAGSYRDGDVRLWQWADGVLEERGSAKHPGSVVRVSLSPDGRTLASWDHKSLRLWEVGKGGVKAKTELAGCVYGAFSPAADLLATVENDANGSPQGVALWDLAGPAPRRKRSWQVPGLVAGRIAFSPNGRALALACSDFAGQSVQLWSVQTASDSPRSTAAVEDVPTGVTFAPDGKTLYVGAGRGGELGSVHVYDVDGMRLTKRWGPRAPLLPPIVYGADGATLATCGPRFGREGSWWDLTGPAPRERPVPAELVGARVCGLSRRGLYLLQGDRLSEWDGEKARFVRAFADVGPHRPPAITPDGRTLALGTLRFRPALEWHLELWNLGGPGVKEETFDGTLAPLAITPDGRVVVAAGVPGSNTGPLHLFARDGGRWKEVWKSPDMVVYPGLALNARGDRLAFRLGLERRLRILDLGRQPPREATQVNLPVDTWCVAFAPDDLAVATGSLSGEVAVWEIGTGKRLGGVRLRGRVDGLAFAPDGRHLAVASGYGVVFVLRLPLPPEPADR